MLAGGREKRADPGEEVGGGIEHGWNQLRV
jgi:hypothetical protein